MLKSCFPGLVVLILLTFNTKVFGQRLEISAGFVVSEIKWKHDFAHKGSPWYEFEQTNYRGVVLGLQLNYLKNDFFYLSSRASLSVMQGDARWHSWLSVGSNNSVLLEQNHYFMIGFTELNTNANFYITKKKSSFTLSLGPQLNIATNIFNSPNTHNEFFSNTTWPENGFKPVIFGANTSAGIKLTGSKFSYGLNFEYFFPFTHLINYADNSNLAARMKIQHLGLRLSFGFL